MLEMIVVFAHWCPTCNMMMPIVEELEADYADRVQMKWIDVEEYPAVYEEYGIQIVPTFIMRRGKEEIARMAGMIGESVLRERIETLDENRL